MHSAVSKTATLNSDETLFALPFALRVADLVDALIEAGADPNCRNDFDWGPLLVSTSWLGSRTNCYVPGQGWLLRAGSMKPPDTIPS